MVNKKKRLRKYLLKRNKEMAKKRTRVEAVAHPKEDNYAKEAENFQLQLEEIYSGTVKPVTKYINDRAAMCFKCEKCGVEFYGKASHMIGKDEHQQHKCHYPYGDRSGVRNSVVNNGKGGGRNKKSTIVNMEEFHKMVWEDYTYLQIAKELQINKNMVKYYFKEEGLI